MSYQQNGKIASILDPLGTIFDFIATKFRYNFIFDTPKSIIFDRNATQSTLKFSLIYDNTLLMTKKYYNF
jgi:hypothetical protein